MTKSNSNFPTEDEEQKRFVAWLDAHEIPNFHVPNETFTKFMSQKVRNKQMGVRAGVPDLFVQIPLKNNEIFREECKFFVNSKILRFIDFRFVAIEMKRQKGGVLRENQKKWLEILEKSGIETFVAHGFDEAKKFITDRMEVEDENFEEF